MTLREVFAWAAAAGRRRAFRGAYRDAIATTAARLLRALQREQLAPATLAPPEAGGPWRLTLGAGPTIVATTTAPGTLGFWEVLGPAVLATPTSTSRLTTVADWTRALTAALDLPAAERDLLCDGFRNSVANLTLNALLATTTAAQAPEPASRGHFLYPLPGLRVGPSVAMVARTSHLGQAPGSLAFLALPRTQFWSGRFATPAACWQTATGAEVPGAAVPIHPWQWELSPHVAGLVALGLARRVDAPGVAIWPLASQRTCRVVATGYDLKLALAATITGEHRLLYRAHVANACAISELVARFSDDDAAARRLGCGFQRDVAAAAYPDEAIGTHVAAIVRAPLPAGPGEVTPALALWETVGAAGPPDLDAYAFFYDYCRLTLGGALVAYARWGLALEPHVQNVLVRRVDGYPTAVIIRDLDATILCPRRIRSALAAERLELGCAEWSRFPSYEEGRDRLAHALVHGNLAIAEATLAKRAGVDRRRLAAAAADAWHACGAELTASERRSVDELRARVTAVKALLRMRLRGSTRMEFAA